MLLDASLVGRVIQDYRESKGLSQEVVSGLADWAHAPERDRARHQEAYTGDVFQNKRGAGNKAE